MSDAYEAAAQRQLIEMAEANSALRIDRRLIRITLSTMRHSLDGWQQDEVTDLIDRIDRALAEKEI